MVIVLVPALSLVLVQLLLGLLGELKLRVLLVFLDLFIIKLVNGVFVVVLGRI